MGRFDAALVMLDVLAAIADQPDLYWIRGQAHAGKGNHERAIADFDQVLSGSPNVGMVYIARGASYEPRAISTKRIADYQKTAQLDPMEKEASDGIARIEVKRVGQAAMASGRMFLSEANRDLLQALV